MSDDCCEGNDGIEICKGDIIIRATPGGYFGTHSKGNKFRAGKIDSKKGKLEVKLGVMDSSWRTCKKYNTLHKDKEQTKIENKIEKTVEKTIQSILDENNQSDISSKIDKKIKIFEEKLKEKFDYQYFLNELDKPGVKINNKKEKINELKEFIKNLNDELKDLFDEIESELNQKNPDILSGSKKKKKQKKRKRKNII